MDVTNRCAAQRPGTVASPTQDASVLPTCRRVKAAERRLSLDLRSSQAAALFPQTRLERERARAKGVTAPPAKWRCQLHTVGRLALVVSRRGVRSSVRLRVAKAEKQRRPLGRKGSQGNPQGCLQPTELLAPSVVVALE
jgi:hypothetical protein